MLACLLILHVPALYKSALVVVPFILHLQLPDFIQVAMQLSHTTHELAIGSMKAHRMCRTRELMSGACVLIQKPPSQL